MKPFFDKGTFETYFPKNNFIHMRKIRLLNPVENQIVASHLNPPFPFQLRLYYIFHTGK